VQPTISLQVQRWQVDDFSGSVTHELSVSGTRCAVSSCSWQIRAWYVSGAVARVQQVIPPGLGTGVYSVSQPTFSGEQSETRIRPEITHLEAVVRRDGVDLATSGLVAVGSDMPPPSIDLSVASWDVDSGGVASAVLYMQAFGLGGVGDHCEYDRLGCSWQLDAGRLVDGVFVRTRQIDYGGSGSGYSGTWRFVKEIPWSGSTSGITHLRAVVKSKDPARGSLEQIVPVSGFIVHDFDMARFVEPLSALMATQGQNLCAPLLFSPVNTDPDSPPDAWKACEEARLAGLPAKQIIRAVVAVGGASAVYMLVDDGSEVSPVPPTYKPPRTKYPWPYEENPEHEPEPAAAGGIVPPPNCMDGAQRSSYLDSLPDQTHHLATNKHRLWTGLMEDIAAEYGLDLDGEWNLLRDIPHRYPHAPEYHDWVLRNLAEIDVEADGDPTIFQYLFQQYVADVVESDPSIVNWRYWWCYR
jgi:hypothetical protein